MAETDDNRAPDRIWIDLTSLERAYEEHYGDYFFDDGNGAKNMAEYKRVHQQSDPWTDACGHVWELRPNTTCVECPHCLFTFAAIHTVEPEGYDCPNCHGCPDTRAPVVDDEREVKQ